MKRWWWVVTLLMLVTVSAARAQPDAGTLVLLIDSDIYLWNEGDGAPVQVTDSGWSQIPAISPDGRQVAYSTAAQVTLDALERTGGFGAGGGLPSDIYVMELANGTATLVAGQAADASFMLEGVPDKGVTRGNPVWSPNGTQLAWAEYDVMDEQQRVVVYELTSGTAETITTLPFPAMSIPNPVRLMWTRSGLVAQTMAAYVDPQSFNVSSEIFVMTYFVLETDGSQRYFIQPEATAERFAFDALVAVRRSDGREFLIVAYNTGAWAAYDLESGALDFIPGNAIHLVSESAAAESVRLWMGTTTIPVNIYRVTSAAREPLLEAVGGLYYEIQPNVAVARDGQAFAYLVSDAANPAPVREAAVWRGGVTTTIPLPEGRGSIQTVVWGAQTWEMDEAAGIEGEAIPQECPGAAPTRLAIGSLARVIPGGGPNRLRSEASAQSAQIGLIAEGDVVTVLYGPICDRDVVWWQVDYNGVVGWTAEGQGGTYFLDPAG